MVNIVTMYPSYCIALRCIASRSAGLTHRILPHNTKRFVHINRPRSSVLPRARTSTDARRRGRPDISRSAAILRALRFDIGGGGGRSNARPGRPPLSIPSHFVRRVSQSPLPPRAEVSFCEIESLDSNLQVSAPRHLVPGFFYLVSLRASFLNFGGIFRQLVHVGGAGEGTGEGQSDELHAVVYC